MTKRKKYFTAILICFLLLILLALCLGIVVKGFSQIETRAQPTEEEGVLTIFVQQSASSQSGIWQGWGAKKLYEDTGITLEFEPTGQESEQRLKQYLVAKDLPDILGFNAIDQVSQVMEAGLLEPLEDSLDDLPSIKDHDEYSQAINYIQEYKSKESGHLYMLPVSVGNSSDAYYNWLPLLQWKKYGELGMPKVETLEDYLDVVESMVNLEPYTKEGDKVYGFSLFSDWDKYTAKQVAALSFFYGIDSENLSDLIEVNVNTNEVATVTSENSFYKRALHFYYEANQRGLLDPDSMTQTYANVVSKLSKGQVMFSYYSWLTGDYNEPSSGNVNNVIEPDGLAPIVAEDMKIYTLADQWLGRNWYFAISKTCKDKDKAYRFLNWLYNPSTISYLMNGPQGVTWDYDENLEPYVTDQGYTIINNSRQELMPEEVGGGSFQDGLYPFNSLGLQAATVMDDGYSIGYRYWPQYTTHSSSLMTQDLLDYLQADSLKDYLEDNDMVSKSTQAVHLVTDPSDEMLDQMTQIGLIIKDYSWKMIYAKDENEFNTLWTKMVEASDDLGMESVEAYYRQSWQEALEIAKRYDQAS